MFHLTGVASPGVPGRLCLESEGAEPKHRPRFGGRHVASLVV